ncbi:hypothetical protein LR48_Vigan10g073300 [Vigna angularis]|uniref:Uncharacterized protein n=1 Tax=Phaseolus angularis TaxID=3914 RepID=A0A0L9VIF4_PHAAN|nr:hypothetical protein LR48_Vigan10g073300 [Vigna angularis]
MTSSSHPSTDRGKVVVAARIGDISEWISDEETRLEFLRRLKFKHIVPHKYLNLDLFEKEGFNFQEWIETQDEGLFSHLRYSETNRWLKKKDMYCNWLRFPGRYTIERLYVHEGLNKEEKIMAHILAWVILPARPVQLQDRMTTEDVFLFKILTLQGVDVSGEKKCSCNCSNVINRNTLTSIGLVKTTKGWCFKDEENMVQSSGGTPALNDDRTNFVPETNFERFVVEKLRRLEQKIDTLHKKKNKNDSPTEDSSEESSEEDSMEIF